MIEPVLKMQDLCFSISSKGSRRARGELGLKRYSLRGPSGCGKTTFLRVLAGLHPLQSGTLSLGNRNISHLLPHERRCGFVFQGSPLFEHLSVLENMTFGMRNFFPTFSEELMKSRALEFLDRVSLKGFESRSTLDLSGGERSRVSIARTLLCEPDFLLLDEPFSTLDETLKLEVMTLLIELIEKKPIPSLLVTHSKNEAELFSSHVVEWSTGDICINFS